jgi:NAD(P)H-dependent FMN reductase
METKMPLRFASIRKGGVVLAVFLILATTLSAPAKSYKLLVNDKTLADSLVAQGAKSVAHYDSFELIETEHLPQAEIAAEQAQLADHLNIIELNVHRLDTTKPEIQGLRKPVSAFSDRRLHLVHFAKPIKPEWLDDLKKTGVQIVSYIQNSAYLVYGDAPSLSRLQTWAISAGIIQWEGEYNGEAVAKWACEIARKRSDAEFELVDIKDFNLPLLDEPVPAAMGNYSKPHTKAWGSKIDSFDGYVFVTPEYNHGMNGALKNAIDFLYREWNNKAAGFVGYGGAGAARAVSQLRAVMGYLQVATVQNQVQLSLMTDFENFNVFKPAEHHQKSVNTMLDQLLAWAGALKSLRGKTA